MLFVLWSKSLCCSLLGFSNLIHTLGFLQCRRLLWTSRALSCSHWDKCCPKKPWVACPAPPAPHLLPAAAAPAPAGLFLCGFSCCCCLCFPAEHPLLSPELRCGSASQSDLQPGETRCTVEMKTWWLLLEHRVSCALFFASDKR